MLRLKALSESCFQTNVEYELLPATSFSNKFPLLHIEKRLDNYILSKSGGTAKLVCSKTANLLTLLKKRGSIPAVLGDSANLDIVLARLVLDGVLQISWNSQFVSGPHAWFALYEGEFSAQKSSCLSSAALCYAQALRLNDVIQLSSRLYSYNCVPITQFWRKRFPDSRAVIEWIGTSPSDISLVHHRGWLAWQIQNWQRQANQALYKLYISPQIAALQECWQQALLAFRQSNVVGLKIGADAYGLLRPDKIVAHFESREALMETANQLKVLLAGFPGQGVPFAAMLDKTGLLSWGVDLPSANQESWRSWLTYRIASAMIAASEVELPVEPWQYAMERLRLEGVNTQDWTPTSELLQ